MRGNNNGKGKKKLRISLNKISVQLVHVLGLQAFPAANGMKKNRTTHAGEA